MASTESAPLGGTAPSTARPERITAEAADEPVGATVELPSASSRASGRRRRARRRDREPEALDGRSVDGGSRVDREPLFAPAKRPGRRVVRIVRHVQLWSVFKVALLGGLVFYAIFLIAAGVAWSLANATGQVHHIEQFMRQIGFDNWSFDGPQLFRATALIGAVLLTAGSVLVTLGAAIVNLIAEATGGIRLTVIELDESDEDDDDEDDATRSRRF